MPQGELNVESAVFKVSSQFWTICTTVNLVPYFRVVVNKTASTPSYDCFYFPRFCCRTHFLTDEHFCFLCFHSRWRFQFSFFWFHKDREITKNLFTFAENNFRERKLSCTCLNFGAILFPGTKRAVPGGQYHSILPARVANQTTDFAAYCPLVEHNSGEQSSEWFEITSTITPELQDKKFHY